ncbi:MAG: universal stress protein, partial [Armatimonadota bacterium]
AEEEMTCWQEQEPAECDVVCRAVAAEARVQQIADEAQHHDIIVMASSGRSGLRRVLFGSLADDVAEVTPTSMLVVAGAMAADVDQFEHYDEIDL